MLKSNSYGITTVFLCQYVVESTKKHHGNAGHVQWKFLELFASE